MLGLNYDQDGDPLAILRTARPRRHLGLCPGRRLPRRHQAAAQGAGALADAEAGGDVKVFVDTAAVMEKPLAAARPGWDGRASTPIWSRRQFGSWLFLGAIFTTLDLPPDAPRPTIAAAAAPVLDICPTAAFPAPYQARCAPLHLLSDHRAQGPDPARAARADGQPHLWLRRLPGGVPLEQVRASRPRGEARRARGACARRGLPSSPARRCAFRRLFAKSPVKRTGRDRFVRNVLIAIGNSGDATLAAEAERLIDDRIAAGARRGGVGAEPTSAAGRFAAGGGRRAQESEPRRARVDGGARRRRLDVRARLSRARLLRPAYVAEFGGASTAS